MALFTEYTATPLNCVGAASVSSVVGVHTLQIGDPSTIATHYGMPNMHASMVGSGRVFVRCPKGPTDTPRSIRPFLQAGSPVVGSGGFLADTYNVQPGSGTFEVGFKQPMATTRVFNYAAPPSGATVDILFFVQPVTTF